LRETETRASTRQTRRSANNNNNDDDDDNKKLFTAKSIETVKYCQEYGCTLTSLYRVYYGPSA